MQVLQRPVREGAPPRHRETAVSDSRGRINGRRGRKPGHNVQYYYQRAGPRRGQGCEDRYGGTGRRTEEGHGNTGRTNPERTQVSQPLQSFAKRDIQSRRTHRDIQRSKYTTGAVSESDRKSTRL